MKGKLWCGLSVSVIALAASLVLAGGALAAPPVSVQTASALDSTHVEITFNRAVDSTATNTAHYVFSPALAVSAAVLGNANRSVTLTTAAQANATVYTVTVSGITNMRGSGQVKFIGTYLGPNDAKTIFEDDFNRPSGLLPTDTPFAGPWTNLVISAGTSNVVTVNPAPNPTPTMPWAGSGALYSKDTPLSGENDNANVQARVSASDIYYSAYLDVPRQTWPAATEVGLLRLNTSAQTAHARLYAFTQSSTAYTLMVNWKNPTGGYNAAGSTVATGVTFNQWHWLQMHVRNGAPGSGEIQVFLDGKLLFQDTSTGVYTGAGKMLYAEAGIMHMTDTTSASTYTDQLRLGTAYTLPSLKNDTTAPSAVTLATSATQIHDPATFTATGKDAIGVQRVDFFLDGTLVGSSDFAPDYHLASGLYTGTYSMSWTPTQASGIADGAHQLTAKVYDTAGNVTTSAPIAVTTDSSGPAIVSPAASPNPFTPNGDGSQDTTHITFTHDDIASYTVQIFSGSTLVKTLESGADVPAADESSSWNGTYFDSGTSSNVPVADGTYTARITVSDSYGRTTTADVPVIVNRTLKGFSRTPAKFNPLSTSASLNHTTGSYSLLADAQVGVTVSDKRRQRGAHDPAADDRRDGQRRHTGRPHVHVGRAQRRRHRGARRHLHADGDGDQRRRHGLAGEDGHDRRDDPDGEPRRADALPDLDARQRRTARGGCHGQRGRGRCRSSSPSRG